MVKRNLQGKFLLALLLLVLALMAANVLFGSVSIPAVEFFRALMGESSVYKNILIHVRLPRMLGSLLCGSALAVSGAILQAVLENPLASPGVMGINAGAGIMVALVSALFPYSFSLSAPAAFVGAFFSSLIVLGLSWRFLAGKNTIVLAGLAVSQIFSAGIDLIVTLVPDALSAYSDFRIGGLASVTFAKLSPVWLIIVIALIFAVASAPELEIVSLGQDQAKSLGLQIRKWTFLFLILASVLTGASISFAGMIGFVGLIVPHMVKRKIRGSSRSYLVACALAGAALMLFADLVSRIIVSPYEISVGILLALAGGPYFLWMLFSGRKKRL